MGGARETFLTVTNEWDTIFSEEPKVCW